jgi:hypothetical protein
MSNKAICEFSIGFLCDGTNASVSVNFNTGPFLLAAVAASEGYSAELSSLFNLSVLAPSAISNLSSSDHTSVSASLGLLGAVTFTWASAPAAGIVILTGILQF